MTTLLRRQPTYAVRARQALGAIRLANGAVGLVAPQVLIRQLGGDPATSPSAVYAFRLFGVRTVLIGLDLLRGEGDHLDRAHLDRALRRAPVIHASDTATALLLATSGRLPTRAGVMISAISAVNTGLALLARAGR